MSMFKKAQQQLAHTSKIPVLGNRDLRSLQDYITQEKSFVAINAKAAAEFQKSAEAAKAWGEGEGEDLADILGKLSTLLTHYTTAQTRLNSHLSTLRLYFKSIRTREESLAALKSQKQRLGSTIEGLEKKLAKMGPEHKELMKTTGELKERKKEMEGLSDEVREEEARLGDFKRRTTREAFTLKCGGLQEFAEKVMIIADVGKLLVNEVPLEPTAPGMPRAPYMSAIRTDQLLQEAQRSISDVGFVPGATGTGEFSRGGRGHLPDDSADLGQANTTRGDEDDLYGDQPAQGVGASYSAADAYDVNSGYGETSAAELQNTPIYAAHQTTQASPWARNEADGSQAGGHGQSGQVATEGLRDTAADEWSRGAEGAIGAAAGSASQNGHPGYAAHDAQGSRQGSQNHATAAGNGAGYSSSRPPTSDGAAPGPGLRSSPDRFSMPPQPPFMTNEAAGSSLNRMSTPPVDGQRHSFLPPLRTSSPLPGSAGGPSLGTGGRPLPPSVYEPAEGGRKMTAAAFRKGFNRIPSNQNVASPLSPGGANAGAGGPGNGMLPSLSQSTIDVPPAPGAWPAGGDGGEASTAPLAIRKRLSTGAPLAGTSAGNEAAHDVMHVQGTSGDPAPPYLAGDGTSGSPDAQPATSFLPSHLRIANADTEIDRAASPAGYSDPNAPRAAHGGQGYAAYGAPSQPRPYY